MTKTRLLMAVFGILAIGMISFAPITAVAQQTSTSTMTISIACGLNVGDALLFGAEVAGTESTEEILILNGTGSGASFDIDVSAKNWLDATDTNIINGELTKFSDVTGNYASKTALNSTDGTIAMGVIPVGNSNSTYWQVLPILNDSEFAGSLSQEMTFVVSGCV